MKKIAFLITFLLLISGCNFAKGTTWQGTYYLDGNLLDENSWEFSPVFYSYEDCKTWVLSKKSSKLDKYTCGQNCEVNEFGTQDCQEVIRNWKATPVSITFEEYKK
ncbi:MAG: hypothetical protein ABH856_01835 [Patescibacteria group bacterium]